MDFVSVPGLIKKVFPGITWEIPTKEKTIYLTFDDGPTPGVTPRVLDLLFEYDAKATFFCTGEKAAQHPELLQKIIENGHTIGNHGYYHTSGWSMSLKDFKENTEKGSIITNSRLFRPPYGRMTPFQYYSIKTDFQIVMWSIMSMDFSKKITPHQCLRNVTDHAYPGSIILFHDSEQAGKNMLKILPEVLTWLNKNNYQIKSISPLSLITVPETGL